MKNLSGGAYTSVAGTLSSTNAYLTLSSTNATFGTIAAGGTASNAYTQLYLSLASTTPAATSLPLSLALRDSIGNTQTLALTVFCLPQLNSSSVAPRLSAPGSTTTITASLRGANYQLTGTEDEMSLSIQQFRKQDPGLIDTRME